MNCGIILKSTYRHCSSMFFFHSDKYLWKSYLLTVYDTIRIFHVYVVKKEKSVTRTTVRIVIPNVRFLLSTTSTHDRYFFLFYLFIYNLIVNEDLLKMYCFSVSEGSALF